MCIYVYTAHQVIVIHPSVDGHLDCFLNLAIINNAAVNMHLFQISVFVFFRYILRCGIAGSYGSSNFSFLRDLHVLFSTIAAPIYIPTISM